MTREQKTKLAKELNEETKKAALNKLLDDAGSRHSVFCGNGEESTMRSLGGAARLHCHEQILFLTIIVCIDCSFDCCSLKGIIMRI
jgi:hypothetical protein